MSLQENYNCRLTNGTLEMYKVVSVDGGSGIFTLLTLCPFGSLISFVVFFNLIIFLITSADSAAFVMLGMVVSTFLMLKKENIK